ncbi:MAG: AAA family ATPase [Nitrososphaeraceae archaeon]
MGATVTSPSDELILPDSIKEYGISKITRHGSIREGYVIHVIINDKPLVFAVGNSWNSALTNLKKACERVGVCQYNANDDETNIRELQCILESTLVQNASWVMGYDLKAAESGFLVKSDSCDADDNESSRISPKILNIPEAIRTHSGIIITDGIIIAVSDIFQLIKRAQWSCYQCTEVIEREVVNILDVPAKPRECIKCRSKLGFSDNHEYINAVSIRVQQEDNRTDNSLDSLRVIVFGDDTYNIQVGERINISGEIVKQQDHKTRQFHTVLLAKRIHYEGRRKVELTPKDIHAIKKFRTFGNYERRLVSMFALNVIGHYDDKLTLVLAAIGAPEYYDKQTKHQVLRGRINILLIGPPGEAKTVLGKEALKLRMNSRYVSGKNTTGGSLTAMILSDENQLTLHLGAAPLAKNAFLFVNEFDKLQDESKDNLLEVMEEGEIIVNKFAQLREISSPTSIIASANPRNEVWMYPNEIEVEEIPFSRRILSRFDTVCVFRDVNTEEADNEYAYTKSSNIEKHVNFNCNFLQKLIEHARTIEPRLTPQAEGILNQYWIALRKKGNATYETTKRTLEVIHRFAKAFARMYLSEIVDAKMAYRTIDFMNTMFKNFKLNVSKKTDPFMDAYSNVIEFLKTKTNSEKPIELVSAIEHVCLQHEDIAVYIGKILKQNQNRKLRDLCTKLLENRQVIRVGEHPTKVYWKADPQILGDVSDVGDSQKSPPRLRNWTSK